MKEQKKILKSHRSSRPEVFSEKSVLANFINSQENNCARVSFIIKLQAQACNFIKKEILAQVFFCEFCEIHRPANLSKKRF